MLSLPKRDPEREEAVMNEDAVDEPTQPAGRTVRPP
jgi:hypothetical protein